MVDAVLSQAPLPDAIEEGPYRQLVMQRRLARLGLQKVDEHLLRAPLETFEEGQGILHVLDDVEGVRQVEAGGRRGAIEVVHLGVQPPPGEAPAEVSNARVVEVRERDGVPGLEKTQAVTANAASDVKQSRGRWYPPRQGAQVWLLGAAHREDRKVVEIGIGGAIEPLVVPESLQLLIHRLQMAAEPPLVVAVAQVFAELCSLGVGVQERQNGAHEWLGRSSD